MLKLARLTISAADGTHEAMDESLTQLKEILIA